MAQTTALSTVRPWILVAGDFRRKGGMDKANLVLAEYLLEKQIPVHVIAHSVEPHIKKNPLAKIYLIPRPGKSFLLGGFALYFWGRILARRIIRKHGPAHVVVNGGNCIWPGINWAHYIHRAWTAPRKGTPWLHRIKGAVSDSWARTSERMAFRRAQLVITNSRRTSREVIEYFGVEAGRVHAVYLGSDPQWGPVEPEERAASRQSLKVSESRPLAAFVGGLGYDHRKGFDLLLGAWEKLCERPDWDVDLLVAGSGPALPMWQARIMQMGLTERIRLLGFSDQVDRVLAAVDLLVSPVRYEAYGLNVQEAICRGIPAMVSACAGVAERYEPDFAPMLIPDPEDLDDLVQRLLVWRSKKDEWSTRFRPFGDLLRLRSWRDTAVDLVSIVQHEEQRGGEEVCLSALATDYSS